MPRRFWMLGQAVRLCRWALTDGDFSKDLAARRSLREAVFLSLSAPASKQKLEGAVYARQWAMAVSKTLGAHWERTPPISGESYLTLKSCGSMVNRIPRSREANSIESLQRIGILSPSRRFRTIHSPPRFGVSKPAIFPSSAWIPNWSLRKRCERPECGCKSSPTRGGSVKWRQNTLPDASAVRGGSSTSGAAVAIPVRGGVETVLKASVANYHEIEVVGGGVRLVRLGDGRSALDF